MTRVGEASPSTALHKRGKIWRDVWKSSRRETLRHIQIAPLGDGWTVGEATLDNAQFFARRSDADRAARDLGARLADAGQPSEVVIRLGGGESGGRFVCSRREPAEPIEP